MNAERDHEPMPPRDGASAGDASGAPRTLDASMTPGDEAWIDQLLRDDAAGQPHVADDGFVVRVLMAMGPARKPAPRWIVPAAALAGGAAAVLLTPAGAWFGTALGELFGGHPWSLAHLLVLVPVAVFYGLSFSALRER